jgi:hypothetical protein
MQSALDVSRLTSYKLQIVAPARCIPSGGVFLCARASVPRFFIRRR